MACPEVRWRFAAVVAMALGLAFHSESGIADEAAYSDPHVLLSQAIRNGEAAGLMTGAIDEHFSRQFNSTGFLGVRARVMHTLPNPDCKRLEVVFVKADVDTPKGRTEGILATQLDYCLDGGPPVSQGTSQ